MKRFLQKMHVYNNLNISMTYFCVVGCNYSKYSIRGLCTKTTRRPVQYQRSGGRSQVPSALHSYQCYHWCVGMLSPCVIHNLFRYFNPSSIYYPPLPSLLFLSALHAFGKRGKGVGLLDYMYYFHGRYV